MIATKVKVDCSGLRELAGRTQATMIHGCEDVADVGAARAVEHAKEHPDFRDRSGALRKSIATTREAHFDGRRALATAAARTPYAAHVEWGTEAHPIRPKMARSFIGPVESGQTRARTNKVPGMLIFFWEKLGRWVELPMVNHPGTRGRYYMSRGARAAYYTMVREWEAVKTRLAAIWH